MISIVKLNLDKRTEIIYHLWLSHAKNMCPQKVVPDEIVKQQVTRKFVSITVDVKPPDPARVGAVEI